MNLVPKSASRFTHRSLLKLSASSPTLLVVGGVVGLGATAVLAAVATRKIDPILDEHTAARWAITESGRKGQDQRTERKMIARVYGRTGWELTKLYGPALVVGSVSTVSILTGHRILNRRHLAAVAAYSGLFEQFREYRQRVSKTLGVEAERDIYDGARGEWQKDQKTGQDKLYPVFDGDPNNAYLQPWFDETNINWTKDPTTNYLFLKGVQQHMNNRLQVRGHVFLNDVFDALGMARVPEGQAAGWVWKDSDGDGYVDFGFMTARDPHSIAFCNYVENTVRLNFNIDGIVWDKI